MNENIDRIEKALVMRLQKLFERALAQFEMELIATSYQSRESETKSRFAFGILSERFRDCQLDPRCIAIEATIPNLDGTMPGRPADLVIWTDPDRAMTFEGEPTRENICHMPAIISEWKVKQPGLRNFQSRFDSGDVQKLVVATREYPESIGYAITIDYTGPHPSVDFARFQGGEET